MYLREDDSSDLMLDQVRKQREKQQKALALLMNPNVRCLPIQLTHALRHSLTQ